MGHVVIILRGRYLGNRSAIEAFHERLGIGVHQDILYSGVMPVAYQYGFDYADHAVLFKLTWG